jgi:hypothetical protein
MSPEGALKQRPGTRTYVGETAFYAALDVAAPRWRERREYPLPFAGFVDRAGRTVWQTVDDVVATALGTSFDPEVPLKEALDERVDRSEARAVLGGLLRTTLAYDSKWLDATNAGQVADAFLSCFSEDAAFLTNGELWRRDEVPRSWTPLTSATFDTGLIGVDGDRAGLVWFLDED